MSITGSTLDFDLDFLVNNNVLFGQLLLIVLFIKLDFTGDSNKIDWNIGYIKVSADSNINFDVTGSSNTFDLDQGYGFSAERLDLKT